MDRGKMLKEIKELSQKYEEKIYSEDLTSEDIQSFKKVLYHLKKDVPELDTTNIHVMVDEIYKVKPKTYFRAVDLMPKNERRRKIKDDHQKKLDIIKKMADLKNR